MFWFAIVAVLALVIGSAGQVAIRAARARPGQLRQWAMLAGGIAVAVILIRYGLPWLAIAGSALVAVSRWSMRLLPVARLFTTWKQGAPTQAGPKAPRDSATRHQLTRSEALAILGLPAGASQAEIAQAYKSLMLKVHPDRGGSAALASQLNEAYRVLKT